MQESPLIGICDGAVNKKETDYYTNKIGGCPDFFPGITNPYNRCSLCDGILTHIVQIYCPLAASLYHRTIHVFACTAPQCCNQPDSWKVLRSQCLESAIKQISKCQASDRTTISTTEWCDAADDWGMEGDASKASEQGEIAAAHAVQDIITGQDVSSRLQDLCINGSVGIKTAELPQTASTFQPFYISVMEEADFASQRDLEHANRLLQEYEEREGVAVREIGCCKEGGEEKYEKTEAKHGDAVFSNFMKRISLCPEQVLRYVWSGAPLFMTEPPSNISQMVPPCTHCGGPRVFEFQLMPALVSLLNNAGLSSELAVEFGTVLVYTCRKSCWTSGATTPVVEYVFVQADPDQKLFK